MDRVNDLVELVAGDDSVAVDVVECEDPLELFVNAPASEDAESDDKVRECYLLFALNVKGVEDEAGVAVRLGASGEELSIDELEFVLLHHSRWTELRPRARGWGGFRKLVSGREG